MKHAFFAAAAALIFCAQAATAATTTYTDRSVWSAAVATTIFTTGFEDNTPVETTSPITITNAALSPVVQSRGGLFADIRQNPDNVSGFGTRTLSTTNFSNFEGGTVRITFDTAITSLGADFYDVDDAGITGFTIVSTGESMFLPAQPNETTTFFGFTSTTAFTQVDITLGGGNEIVFMDNMAYDVPTIPLPAPALMLIAGIGALALRRKA